MILHRQPPNFVSQLPKYLSKRQGDGSFVFSLALPLTNGVADESGVLITIIVYAENKVKFGQKKNRGEMFRPGLLPLTVSPF